MLPDDDADAGSLGFFSVSKELRDVEAEQKRRAAAPEWQRLSQLPFDTTERQRRYSQQRRRARSDVHRLRDRAVRRMHARQGICSYISCSGLKCPRR